MEFYEPPKVGKPRAVSLSAADSNLFLQKRAERYQREDPNIQEPNPVQGKEKNIEASLSME